MNQFLLCLLIVLSCFLLGFGWEIWFGDNGEDLVTPAKFGDCQSVDFKLTFNANRAIIRENNGWFPFTDGKSYSTQGMTLWDKKNETNDCITDKLFQNYLIFNEETVIRKIELQASHEPSTSKWRRYQGILGLNPMSLCDRKKLDPKALVNDLKGKEKGFILDYPRLVFTSSFDSPIQSSFDGTFFDIQEIKIGLLDAIPNVKGKIDLDSNLIKVPTEIFMNFITKHCGTSEYEKKNNRVIEIRYKGSTRAFKKFELKFFNQSVLKIPITSKYWMRGKNFFSDNSLRIKDVVNSVFAPHSEDYWSFGTQFLTDFKVSFDLDGGLIYFAKKTNEQ